MAVLCRLCALPELIETFLDCARHKLSRSPRTLSSQALQCLWIRGGRAAVRRHHPARASSARHSEDGPSGTRAAPGRSLDETIEDIERPMILSALGRASGVQVRAARLLGITEQSLWYRMKK